MKRRKYQGQRPNAPIDGALVIAAHGIEGHLDKIKTSVGDTQNTVLYAKTPSEIYQRVRDSNTNQHSVDAVVTGTFMCEGGLDLLFSQRGYISCNDIGKNVHSISPGTVVIAYCHPGFTALRRHDGIDAYMPPHDNSKASLIRLLSDPDLILIREIVSQNPNIRREARLHFRGKYRMRFSDEHQQSHGEPERQPVTNRFGHPSSPHDKQRLKSGPDGIHYGT